MDPESVSPISSNLCPYQKAKRYWPELGNHIICHYTSEYIVLYKSFPRHVASVAVNLQSLRDSPKFNHISHLNINTSEWILKTNFLDMMYASGWSTKNEDHVLAITIYRRAFEELLRYAVKNIREEVEDPEVLYFWTYAFSPIGEELERGTLELRIKGNLLKLLINCWIIKIEDVTKIARTERKNALFNSDKLHVPIEKVYSFYDPKLARRVGIDQTTNFKPRMDGEIPRFPLH